jgi:hypothetical protein
MCRNIALASGLLYFFGIIDQVTSMCWSIVTRSVLRQVTPLAVALTNLESLKKNVRKYVKTNLLKNNSRKEEDVQL